MKQNLCEKNKNRRKTSVHKQKVFSDEKPMRNKQKIEIGT
jgi:hypothetical protein